MAAIKRNKLKTLQEISEATGGLFEQPRNESDRGKGQPLALSGLTLVASRSGRDRAVP
jgi:hypothetical protein